MIPLVAMVLACVLLVRAQGHKTATAVPANRDQEAFNAVAKLEDQLRLATLKGDATWWDVYLSDYYTDTDSRGKISNKAAAVAMHRSPDLSFDTMNLSDRSVHVFNGDTVIVTGKVTIEGTYGGQSLSGDYQFTRVWTKSGLEWKLAASQSTKIAP
jgi:hypothetical protein